MLGAFDEGVKVSRFIRDMESKGLSYRRTTMLNDWRSVNELKTKEGLMQYVRRDRYPAKTAIASVTWNISKEYMYVIKVRSILRPGDDPTEQKINIMSDVPMTPGMVEAEVAERWGEWEKYQGQTLTEIVPWAAVRKVME